MRLSPSACPVFHASPVSLGLPRWRWWHGTSSRQRARSAPAVYASCLRHLLPNLAPILIVITTLDLGSAVLFTATLSFLGLGAQPPTPEWGAMLNAGREYVRYAPWTMIFPGLALFLTVMAVNLVGDRLSLVLDPRQRDRT